MVEGTGLENRQGRKPFVGSNPTPSAIFSAGYCVSIATADNGANIRTHEGILLVWFDKFAGSEFEPRAARAPKG